MKQLLNDLEKLIPKHDTINLNISQGSVGWHIEHSLLVITKIIKELQNSNPKDYKWHFNFNRLLVFTLNKIPRGKARAPKQVVPSISIDEASLYHTLNLAKEYVNSLDTLNKNNFFKHPYFNNLNLKSTTFFLRLHTNHHLKIIKDIITNN